MLTEHRLEQYLAHAAAAETGYDGDPTSMNPQTYLRQGSPPYTAFYYLETPAGANPHAPLRRPVNRPIRYSRKTIDRLVERGLLKWVYMYHRVPNKVLVHKNYPLPSVEEDEAKWKRLREENQLRLKEERAKTFAGPPMALHVAESLIDNLDLGDPTLDAITLAGCIDGALREWQDRKHKGGM